LADILIADGVLLPIFWNESHICRIYHAQCANHPNLVAIVTTKAEIFGALPPAIAILPRISAQTK
jgi:hypothetical protein